MEERPFNEKTLKPTTESLKKALKATFKSYEALLQEASGFKQEWNFSKSSGWMQKVSDSKKALFYLIPLQGSYKISLTVREHEKERLLDDTGVKFFHATLQAAKKYPEGYAMQFLVQNNTDAKNCLDFLKKLITLR